MQNSNNKEENTMSMGEVISKSLPRRLLLLTLGLFVFFSVLSAVYLYGDIYKPLNTHYSAIVSILNNLHETLIMKTLKINAVFFLITFAGILILGILYTHRVCGPLHKVNLCSKSVAEGKIDTSIKFRKKDAIHAFGDIFNNMTQNYSDKITMLNTETDRLKEAMTNIKVQAEEGKVSENDMRKAHEINEKIKDILKTIKL